MSFIKKLTTAVVASALLAAPGAAWAVSALSFDQAEVVAPDEWESGGGFTFGTSDVFYGFGMGRLGIVEDLEAQIRAGVIGLNDQAGFEVEAGTKFRFLRRQDTGGAVDLAFVAMGSMLKTRDVFVFGADPSLLASHRFDLSAARSIFVSAHVGMALTFSDVDGADSNTEIGLVGGLAFGVDIVESVRLSLEGRIRDDDERAGVLATYRF